MPETKITVKLNSDGVQEIIVEGYQVKDITEKCACLLDNLVELVPKEKVEKEED